MLHLPDFRKPITNLLESTKKVCFVRTLLSDHTNIVKSPTEEEYDGDGNPLNYWYFNTWNKNYFIDFIEKLGWKTELIPDEFDPTTIQKEFENIKTEDLTIFVAEFLLIKPEFRGIIRRIQSLEKFQFAEIKDNILSKKTMPIDMLRFKLSFFGANRYDPKSDRWLRVSFFSGAPYLSNLTAQNVDDWGFATMNSYD